MPKAKSTSLSIEKRLLTGIPGLDDILCGGLTPNRLYLVEGAPGSGKTTLGMQFLMEGARLGEAVLYVTLAESEEELREVAASHGWSLMGIALRELIPTEDNLEPDEQYTMFHPSEIELTETTKTILADVESVKPVRVVFDSLSELKLLAGSALRYRRQILALKHFFAGRKCTVLLLDDMTSSTRDLQFQSIVHGVIRLEQLYPEYGSERRRLMIPKFRGSAFRGGYHDYKLVKGGLEVFPQLVAGEHESAGVSEQFESGVKELDELLGGGIDTGTSALIVGAAGTGKSSVAAQFVAAASIRGQKTCMFLFDETIDTMLARTRSLGMDLKKHINSGVLTAQRIDPAEFSPGELVHKIRACVENKKVSVVVIDSLNGYLNAMPDERFLVIQLHELLTYLAQRNIATILISAQKGLVGTAMQSPVDATYLADTVVLMRYYEMKGEIRQAISVIKKRRGKHERTIRDFKLGEKGITVGPPLKEYHGVLTGIPTLDEGVE